MLTGFAIGDRGLGTSGDTHPNWMMAHAEIGSYLVVGASAVGQSHVAKQLPRDDAFAIRSAGSWLAVAVADGVGARPLSRYGAAYVVESLTQLLLRKLTPSLKEEKNKVSLDPSPIRVPLQDDAELKHLAPPPEAERIELRLWADENTTDGDTTESPSQDVKVRKLHQVSSTGWWLTPQLAPVETKQEALSPTQQFKAPTPPTQSQATGQADVAVLSNTYDLKEIMNHAFVNTHIGLREQAHYLELELSDLSCTALALLLNVETGEAVVGQVGDGAILGLFAEENVEELVHAADTGDPQSTYTISRPNFSKYLGIHLIEPVPANPFKAFYVMTDGLSGDLLYSPQSVATWATGVNENLRTASSAATAATGMLNWLSTYQVKGSWDDRTLVVIMQREKSDGDSQPVTEQQPANSTDNN